MRPFFLLLSIVLTVLFAVAGNASYAQSSAPQGQPLRSDWRPGVRYTTGSYTVSGWEKQLVGGNPNLGHWNWSPVIGYTQGCVHGGTKTQTNTAAMPERKSVYIKPNHVPLPTVVRPTAKVSRLQPTITKIEPVDGSSSIHTESQTQAVLSYGGDYRGADGFRAASSVHGNLAHRGVGAMLSQSLHY